MPSARRALPDPTPPAAPARSPRVPPPPRDLSLVRASSAGVGGARARAAERGRAGAWALLPGFTLVLAAAALLAGCGDDSTKPPAPHETAFQAEVRQARELAGLPALAAAVVDAEGVVDLGVSGVRQLGTTAEVRDTDFFAVGSCAKAMTATMIATLVEDGFLDWDTKVTDVLPEIVPTMDPRHAGITLHHLLSHHSGLLAFHDEELSVEPPELTGTMPEQRRAATAWLFSLPPLTELGTYDYSNAGYAVAATMAEVAADRPYEELMRERLFTPLGMTAEIGNPYLHLSSQPSGHDWTGSAYTPLNVENDPIFLPAGGYSITIGDFAKFARMHLRGMRGETTLLAPETVARLHAPAFDDGSAYGYGWMISDTPPAQFHGGYISGWEAFVVIRPDEDRAFVFATNSSQYPSEEHPEELTRFYLAVSDLLPEEKAMGKARRRW